MLSTSPTTSDVLSRSNVGFSKHPLLLPNKKQCRYPQEARFYTGRKDYMRIPPLGGTSHETNSLCVLNKPGSGSTFELEYLSAL